jgi:SAM-dependent methyltransferase
MVFRLRRMRAMDPLQVAMTGVRMGERYVQIFCNDVTLTAGLAGKVGLSGVAAVAVADETEAARARNTARKAGALVDVQVTPLASLPWPRDSFDMVVIDNTGEDFTALTDSDRLALLTAASRVLRQGGRVEVIERIRSTSSETTLRAAGLRPVRTLAEKDGFRFVEGLNA